MTRRKPFLTYFVLCAIPLLLLAGLNYWNGLRTVDSTLSTIVQNDLNSFTAGVDETIRENEDVIRRLVMAPDVQRVVVEKSGDVSSPVAKGQWKSLILFDRDRQP